MTTTKQKQKTYNLYGTRNNNYRDQLIASGVDIQMIQQCIKAAIEQGWYHIYYNEEEGE